MNRFLKNLTDPVQSILIGYLGFFVGMLVCILIRPEGLMADQGFSYFGGFINTGLISLLSYLWTSMFLYWAAQLLERENPKKLRYIAVCLKVMAVLIILIGLTPHTILDQIHKVFGSALFILQLGLSFVFVSQKEFAKFRLLLIFVELASGIASAYYLPLDKGYLLETQFLYQLAFFGILLNVLKNRASSMHHSSES